jgi:hypothetical protein
VSKRRKSVRVLVIVGAIVLLLAAGCYLFTRDDPPPADADLRLERERVPDTANAFYYLRCAADAHHRPEYSGSGPDEVSVLEPDGWDQEFVDTILAMNEDAFRLLEQGLECERCQLPLVRDHGASLPYLAKLRGLARVMRVRAEDSLRSGRDVDAFNEAMAIVRLGYAVEANANCAITYILGSNIRHIGLMQIRSMLSRVVVEPDTLRLHARELEHCGVSADGLALAYRAEYGMYCRAIDQVAAGWLLPHEIGAEPRGVSGSTRAFRRLRNVFRLKPNRTKGILAHSTRVLIRNASKPYGDRELIPVSNVLSRTERRRLALEGNLLGEGLRYGFVIGVSLHEFKSGAASSVAATQILIALKCCQLEHGELPDTLDALVPDYLDAIPLDDFDGKPMKYSKEKKVVYAVGKDLTDNGGIERREGFDDDGYDLMYKIEF